MITLFVASLFATGLVLFGTPIVVFALMLETCDERRMSETRPRTRDIDVEDQNSLGLDLSPVSS